MYYNGLGKIRLIICRKPDGGKLVEFFKSIILFWWENIVFFLPISTRRKREAEEILSDLRNLKKTNPEYVFAADLNIEFVRAATNLFSYVRWLVKRAPALRRQHRDDILELMDLPFESWQKETHEKLTILERTLKPIPDLLKPVRECIVAEIIRLRGKDGSIKLLSLGCGGMELERQIIERLHKIDFTSHYPIIFIGVDKCADAIGLVKENLSLVSHNLIDIRSVTDLDAQTINELSEETKCQFKVVILQSDIFALEKLPANWIDVVYCARFKHHLDRPKEQKRLDSIMTHLTSNVAIEFDDMCSIPIFIFPSVLTWRWIVTLNGAILSYLRDPSKEELLAQSDGWGLQFDDKFGYYLRTFQFKGQ